MSDLVAYHMTIIEEGVAHKEFTIFEEEVISISF